MITGMDLSSNQLYWYAFWSSYDFEKAKAGGIQYYIKRISRTDNTGKVIEDTRWKHYEDDNKSILDLGRYAYIRLTYDPVSQANEFLRLTAYRKPKRVWVDVELETPPYSKKENADRLQKYLDIVERNTNIVPGIYSRQTWFDTYIEERDWSRYPLWVARYVLYNENLLQPYMSSPWADGNYEMSGWSTWNVWQFTDQAKGKLLGAQSEELDLNVFNGNMNDLLAMSFASDASPNIVYTVVQDNLRIRSEPNTSAAIIGTRVLNEIVKPVEFGGSDLWVKDEKGWSAVKIGTSQFMRQN